MLSLCWSDGASCLPLDFSLLSSSKAQKRLCQSSKNMDRRCCAYQRRSELTWLAYHEQVADRKNGGVGTFEGNITDDPKNGTDHPQSGRFDEAPSKVAEKHSHDRRTLNVRHRIRNSVVFLCSGTLHRQQPVNSLLFYQTTERSDHIIQRWTFDVRKNVRGLNVSPDRSEPFRVARA